MKIDTLHALLIHELQDLYSAEMQIEKALPKMVKAVSNLKLREALQTHLEETRQQIKRLKEVSEILEAPLNGKTCKGMKGLLEEGEEALKEIKDPEVRDAAIIGAAQKVEHYEIAGYGTVITYAKLMKHVEVVQVLKETMGEEEAVDKKLTRIAEGGVNQEANTS